MEARTSWGRLEERVWTANHTAYGPRRNRENFVYRAYIPPFLATADLYLPTDVAESATQAEARVRDLNHFPPPLGAFENLARRLLRAESVASSRIEGLEMSHRRLARAEFIPAKDRDFDASSVLANIRAMERAIEIGSSGQPLTTAEIVEIHQELLTHPRDRQHAGVIRTSQNWIGAGDTPRGADFIPPPEEYVTPLLDDLCLFINRDDIPSVVQAALAHAQFETIHPFADGNGRVGRCLIHVILRRRGVAPRYVPPISLVLAASASRYVGGLTLYRAGDVDEWSRIFSWATSAAANGARDFAAKVEQLQRSWAEKLGNPRGNTAVMKLIAALPGQPILDIKRAAAITGTTDEGARLALHALADADILSVIEVSERRRAWEAPSLFDVVNGFERRVGVPEDGTDPSRRLPRGPQEVAPDAETAHN